QAANLAMPRPDGLGRLPASPHYRAYRPETVQLKTRMTNSLQLGIDLGGTKIEIIALDNGHELLRRRVATPQGDYDGTLQAICRLVGTTEQQLGTRGSLGIGIPGTRSPDTGLIKNANSTCLIGRDLQADLE